MTVSAKICFLNFTLLKPLTAAGSGPLPFHDLMLVGVFRCWTMSFSDFFLGTLYVLDGPGFFGGAVD
jgi:hypothetical protein